MLKLNKLSSSMMYLTPMSMQFLMPSFMKSAMYLYKYLDQSWLENIISMGLQKQMNYKSSNTNSMLSISHQKILMHSLISLTMLNMLVYMFLS